MTEQLDLVCLASTRWDYIWQRPQQLMSRFAESHRVFYIDHVHPAANHEIFTMLSNPAALLKRVRKINNKLTVLSLVEFWPDAFGNKLNETDINELNKYIKTLFISTAMEELGFNNPVIWTCLPDSLPIVQRLPHRLLCYDCVDDFASFSWWPASIKGEEVTLIKTADVVITTAKKTL